MKIKSTEPSIKIELTLEESAKLSVNLEGFEDDFTTALRETLRKAIEQCG